LQNLYKNKRQESIYIYWKKWHNTHTHTHIYIYIYIYIHCKQGYCYIIDNTALQYHEIRCIFYIFSSNFISKVIVTPATKIVKLILIIIYEYLSTTIRTGLTDNTSLFYLLNAWNKIRNKRNKNRGEKIQFRIQSILIIIIIIIIIIIVIP
jgi:hypothetical protein